MLAFSLINHVIYRIKKKKQNKLSICRITFFFLLYFYFIYFSFLFSVLCSNHCEAIQIIVIDRMKPNALPVSMYSG